LYSIKPIAPSRRSTPQKVARTAPSGLHALLRCLLAKPELARAFPQEVLSDDAEAATIRALIEWVKEQQEEVSVAAMTQSFQGTSHEAALAAVQAEVMQWGENFDVDAEFHGVMSKLREEVLKQEFQLLQDKLLRTETLNESEQVRYMQIPKMMNRQRS
jgi:DNA primase